MSQHLPDLVEQSDICEKLPAVAGTYLLILVLPQALTLTIGKLGSSTFPSGVYIYVGSAFGPGGLAERLKRHLQRQKRTHWHIDYVRAVATLVDIWYVPSAVRYECQWATLLSRQKAWNVVMAGFGASDCRCQTHLFHGQHRPNRREFEKHLNISSLISVKSKKGIEFSNR